MEPNPTLSSVAAGSNTAGSDTTNGANSNSRSKPSKGGPLRWTIRGLVLIALVVAAYLVAVQLFLNTPLGSYWINRNPEKFAIRWQGGSMWKPGEVTVHGVTIEANNTKGKWSATIDHAELQLDLKALKERILRFDQVRAESCFVGFLSRPKLPGERPGTPKSPPSQSSQGAAKDAPEAEPVKSRRPPAKWSFEFPQIEIHGLRQVQLDGNLIDAGNRPGHGVVALNFRPRGPVEVPALNVELNGGRVLIQGQDQGSFSRLQAQAQLDPMVPRDNRGGRWLAFLTAEVALASEAWSLSSGFDATSSLLGDLPVAVGGRGALEAEVGLHRGRLRAGSHLNVSGDAVEVEYLGYRGVGAGELKMNVDDELRLTLELADYTVSKPPLGKYIEGHGLRLEAGSPALDITRPAPEAWATVTVPRSVVPDFAVYDHYLPSKSPVRLKAGQGEIEARMAFDVKEGQAPQLNGQVRLRAREAVGTYGDKELQGHVDLATQFEGEIEPDRPWQPLRVHTTSLNLDEVRRRGSDQRPWWARVEIADGHLTLGRPMGISADVTAAVADSRPLVALALPNRELPGWVERMLVLKRLNLSSRVRLDEDHIIARDLVLRGGQHLTADAELLLADRAALGLVLIRHRKLAVAVELGPEAGEREIDWIGARKFFRQREAQWEQRLDQ